MSDSPDRMDYERAKLRVNEKPRMRLSIQDFDALGINLAEEAWKGLLAIQATNNPIAFMKAFNELLEYITPKYSSVSIEAEIKADASVNLQGISSAQLVELAKEKSA